MMINMFKPNLVPPLTKVKDVLDYKNRLEKLAPGVNFLMSLYLHTDITPETIIEAKRAGITGVKSYPAGMVLTSDEIFMQLTQSRSNNKLFIRSC
jgi:dihydroorotase